MKLLWCFETLLLLLIVLVILLNNAEWLRNEEKPNCCTYSTTYYLFLPYLCTSRDDSLLRCSLDSRLLTVVMTVLPVMAIFFNHSESHNFQSTLAYTARDACLNYSYITYNGFSYLHARIGLDVPSMNRCRPSNTHGTSFTYYCTIVEPDIFRPTPSPSRPFLSPGTMLSVACLYPHIAAYIKVQW